MNILGSACTSLYVSIAEICSQLVRLLGCRSQVLDLVGMEETFLPRRLGIQELGRICVFLYRLYPQTGMHFVGVCTKEIRDRSLFRCCTNLVLRTRPANQALSSCQLATGTLDGMSRAKTNHWGITACS